MIRLPPISTRTAPSFPTRRSSDLSTKTTHGSMHVRRFRSDAPPACFGGLAPMVAAWQGKCRNDALPRWKDFASEDFVGLHRYVGLSAREPAGAPSFTILSTDAAEPTDADLTGNRSAAGLQA